MDLKVKKCSTSRTLLRPSCVDRLTNLPDELLGQLLSLLPTKDVAVMQVLCKSMTRRAFTWITCVDLDDLSVSRCVGNSDLMVHLRFALFEVFVDKVLRTISESRQTLTRFRLRFGGDKTNYIEPIGERHYCDEHCFPKVLPARLYAWISYPLAHLGLKELDLTFHVRKPSDCQLPLGIFACQSLEVLKLDSNLKLDGAEIPLISLPNVKLLHLHSFHIVEHAFIDRLVSSCPSLEDLAVAYCLWEELDCLSISSRTLKRLVLVIRHDDGEYNSDLVIIDAPNLHYFHYGDNLSNCYSITNMNALCRAEVVLEAPLMYQSYEECLLMQLSLVKKLSNVQHLSLLGTCVENMHFGGEFIDQLPVFLNLKTLELGGNSWQARWDTVLLGILTCSPCLETLAFPKGLFDDYAHTRNDHPVFNEVADLEDQIWKTTKANPQCFHSNLKRIVIENYFGIARELNIIKFLLIKISVLEEFVICLSSTRLGADMVLESTLRELSRASITCSILVQ